MLLPAAAHACAVCGAGLQDRSANAFVGITALLSLLPMGMIGAGLWWTRRNLWSSLGGNPDDRASDPEDHTPPEPPNAQPGA